MRLVINMIGCALYFSVRRYFHSSDYMWLMLVTAVALVVASLLLTLWQADRKQKQLLVREARSLHYTLIWQGLVLLSLLSHVVYFLLTRDAPQLDTFPKKLLLALWVLSACIGAVMAISMEWSMLANKQFSDPQRIWKTGVSCSLSGILLLLLVNVNYLASEHNHISDWSYLRVTALSATSQQLLLQLDVELQVYAFFRKGSEVYPYVNEYLQALASEKVTVSVVDKDLQPALAERFRVYDNGNIIFTFARQGQDKQKSERVYLGTQLRIARDRLRNLDASFQQALLRLQAKPRYVYFWRGHGEFTWDYHARAPRAIRHLRAILQKQNLRLRELTVATGGMQQIPAEASLLVIAAPTVPFLAQEVQALRAYLQRGGKAFIFLDIEQGEMSSDVAPPEQPLEMFLRAEVGLHLQREVLANDRVYVAARKSEIDRWFIATNNFTSHVSVSTMANNDDKVHVIFFQSGYFTLLAGAGVWETQAVIKSLPTTFVDLNKNFTFERKSEKRAAYMHCAASVWLEAGSKIFACADATVLSDPLLQNAGNRLLVVDALRWLLEEKQLGISSSEVDVKIMHSGGEHTFLFYSTIGIFPCLVLLFGYFMLRRRRGSRHA